MAKAALPLDAESTALLRQAQLEYLKGHLIEAESRLTTLLSRTPGDVEAWLLLASVQRRTKRPAEARQSISKLAELSGSVVWADEVQRELAKIQHLEREIARMPATTLSKAA
jgi:Flp pilus assembly protein TadD